MDFRSLVCVILLYYSIDAYPHEEDANQSGDYSSSFEYEDDLSDELPQKETKDLKVTENPKVPTYEVTEIVIDIPDDRTRGPIVTNFTISKPLNVACSPVTTETTEKPDSKDKNDTNKQTTDEDGKRTRNYISILHIKAQYDDKTKEKVDSNDFDFANVPHVSGIKEYFKGIKQGIVNGFNSIIYKKNNHEENHSHNADTAPFSFLNKIHKSSSDFAKKIRSQIFGDDENF